MVATTFEEPAWEERYQSRPSVWSGQPNPQLVAEATDLTRGRALDVGSGEGADAVWLAERGWQVTAVDISSTALNRAAAHADTVGVANRIEFTTPTCATSRPPRRRTTWCPRSSCTWPRSSGGSCSVGWPQRSRRVASC
ncbi:class I SAM-dependent methyltransferase [Micromonospora sp. M12]